MCRCGLTSLLRPCFLSAGWTGKRSTCDATNLPFWPHLAGQRGAPEGKWKLRRRHSRHGFPLKRYVVRRHRQPYTWEPCMANSRVAVDPHEGRDRPCGGAHAVQAATQDISKRLNRRTAYCPAAIGSYSAAANVGRALTCLLGAPHAAEASRDSVPRLSFGEAPYSSCQHTVS